MMVEQDRVIKFEYLLARWQGVITAAFLLAVIFGSHEGASNG